MLIGAGVNFVNRSMRSCFIFKNYLVVTSDTNNLSNIQYQVTKIK